MQKDEILSLLKNVETAVETQDVAAIFNLMDKLKIDTRFFSPLHDYVQSIMVDALTAKVGRLKTGKLRIGRKTEYGNDTFDVYTLRDGELYRDGHSAKFDSIGKLYVAYQHITKKGEDNDKIQ